MTAFRSVRGLQLGGFAIGASLAASMLVSWHIPGGNGVAGLDLTITVNPTGELLVTPPGTVLRADGMTGTRAASDLQGSFILGNRTGLTLAVSVRAVGSNPSADGALRLEILAGDSPIFEGSLTSLRSWTPEAITLASGASSRVTLRAWLGEGGARFEGGEQALELVFRSIPDGG